MRAGLTTRPRGLGARHGCCSVRRPWRHTATRPTSSELRPRPCGPVGATSCTRSRPAGAAPFARGGLHRPSGAFPLLPLSLLSALRASPGCRLPVRHRVRHRRRARQETAQKSGGSCMQQSGAWALVSITLKTGGPGSSIVAFFLLPQRPPADRLPCNVPGYSRGP